MRQAHRAALAVGLVGLLAGCGPIGPDRTDAVTPSPPDASASSTSSGGTTPPDEVVSVEREWHEARVRFDLRPVEVDDDLAVLRYEFTAEPAGDDRLRFSTVTLSLGGLGKSVTDGRGVRLVDTAAGVVHPVATAADGSAAALIEQVGRGSGDETLRGSAVAVFAAPAGDSVDVLLPGYGAVTLPVAAAGDDLAEAVEQVGGVEQTTTKPLRAFTQGYDAESATSAEEEDVTVTLASDVLFATDEHTMSRAARGVVERAAASIVEQADAGEVHVVGHTDDVDTDAYNQALSERRARSVAERLRADLGDGFTVTEEGRGESEPVAEGTGDEARAANRRVEIHFEGHLVIESEEARNDLPGTDAPTARSAAVTIATDDGEYTVEVESMVRRPGAIVGTLVAERATGTAVDPAWFLPAHLKLFGDRKFGTLAEVAGPHNLSLLAPQERVLPFDYVAETRSGGFVLRRLAGDEEVQTLDRGQSTAITVVWPDTGQDTVTVDGPDRFRITDVPVTDPPVTDQAGE
ncbi:OmpA family protein [Promicromonospora iranensis]|uniref:Outer membrane protein OmpA-like peptidoglycan-associated protein n=1 Tax=Promicromonospora iranensis TaxID=1105144 RepID=A0ABU2CJY8_9MICO|nr:OmpA family protein [Promicromonospora iranensis]MDR7381651.1 outer membrane protein OmpA-like peptidoglycan-associated protein [Promicromonospora iranensis]